MPGICGIVNGYDSVENLYLPLLTTNFVELKSKYKDDVAQFSCVALKVNDSKYYESEEILVYVDGHIYNLEEINMSFGYEATFFADLLQIAYKEEKLKDVLNKIDGYYVACIYDKTRKKISIFADRFGMKYLYWYFKDGIFAFANEMKCFFCAENIPCTLNEKLVQDYVNNKLPYLIQDETWFKEIKLLKPSTILEFDLKSKALKESLYWSYSEIKQQNLTYEEAVDKLHNILLTETKKKLDIIKDRKIGLSLSGGLDSRLCLGLALECGIIPSYIWTMGEKNSSDVEIAREVCNKFNLEFHHLEMNTSNFFTPRISAVWQTDGQMNFIDTHGCEFNSMLGEKFSCIISGFAGDAVLGETFKDKNSWFNKRMNEFIAKEFYGDYLASRFSDIDASYYDTPHFEPHIYDNRVRRYTNNGFVLCAPYFEYITPLFSNKIIEFVFSIPDEYRANNNLYSDMLLKYYPEFYENIVWNKNNLPIRGKIYKNDKKNINGNIKRINWFKILPKKYRKRLVKRLIKRSKYGKYNKSFFDYKKALNDKGVVDKFSYYLNTNTLCKKYVDKDMFQNILTCIQNNQLDKLDFKNVYKILTMEIYLRELQQFAEKQNKNGK